MKECRILRWRDRRASVVGGLEGMVARWISKSPTRHNILTVGSNEWRKPTNDAVGRSLPGK